MTHAATLLEIDRLCVSFCLPQGMVRAVDRVSLSVATGEAVGLIGETGCGKSLTALSVMRLQPASAAISGSVRYRNIDLLTCSEQQLRGIRGSRIAMVFQDAMTALNPVMTIGSQVAEAMRAHGWGRSEAIERTLEMLTLVRIPDPARRRHEYPHQLSGGMRQRVAIAMALACKPDVLIADEPTSALDVVTQAQLLDDLGTLQRSLGMGLLLITHDFGVLARLCDRVVVMYAGRKVEEARTHDLFEKPLHPYTRSLIEATPSLSTRQDHLAQIRGEVVYPATDSLGCSFAHRCIYASARCAAESPSLVKFTATSGAAGSREVACFAVEEGRTTETYSGTT